MIVADFDKASKLATNTFAHPIKMSTEVALLNSSRHDNYSGSAWRRSIVITATARRDGVSMKHG